MNQTAHISLQFYSVFKERSDNKTEMRPITPARPALSAPGFIKRHVAIQPGCRNQQNITASPVKRVLRLGTDTRNPFFHEKPIFLQVS
ncbi:hypothetical protein [Aestuariivita sp.]|uniref:hypothetical protein n=1 Tax=Aestuariivita sp. TaxID=1872407 RepID=UPI003BAF47EC